MAAEVLGALLAGGAGARLGGSKATVELAGKPMLSFPLTAFAQAGIEAIVVAKADTPLPALDVPVVREPGEPRHPLLGVVTALDRAAGRPVVVCPTDTPFVTAALLQRLAAVEGTAAVRGAGRVHPLLARYESGDRDLLERCLLAGDSAQAALGSLAPVLIEAGEREVFNVNTPADLQRAQDMSKPGEDRLRGGPGKDIEEQ